MTTVLGADRASVHVRLEVLERAVSAVAAVEPADLDGAAAAELFTRLHHVADRLRALAVSVLPVIETDGLWAVEGHRTAAQWVVHRTGVSASAARRDLRLGRALRDELPVTGEAVRAGTVGVEHARVLAGVAATSDARREALADPGSACGEGFLVRHAASLPVDPFRSLVRRWAAAADPDADDRGYTDAVQREFLDVSATLGGYHLAGFLTHEHGTVLATALAAVTTAPQGADPTRERSAAADESGAPRDERSAGQRRAQALCDLARTVLDRGLAGAGAAVRPHLTIHLDAEHLLPAWTERLRHAATTPDVTAGAARSSGTGPGAPRAGTAGPATWDDTTPVPLTVLRRLACDSEITRILLGPGSTILDVGRAARTVTGQLRRAVITRDRHCAYPGCHTPPDRCEVHHPHHWADGGPTSLTNSVLLCWHHHDHVHRTGTTITTDATGTTSTMTVHPRWVFHDRNGRHLGTTGPPLSRPPPRTP
ncbi:HNH endonuclease signature motif containing protein [Actinotalea sp. Marseille-Q4924]|uniref:HNH endonuclease signature motif containing protein n=1 Tax=Actinotalea sp. Marseille-Q4924 TaxID=2866571 RepID=UPI001CE444AE|nr:HNH endonuclease signature motif containing protein [Actinotalea sp. Marseille-Q4924]